MRKVNNESPFIKIVYYTHPLCPLSWEMQRAWERIIQEFGHLSRFYLCMGNVADETITALGYEPKKNARDMTCLAVKAASLQSQPAANLYLAYLRQAFMVGGSDPSSLDTLIEIARHVSRRHPDMLNFQRFFEQFDCAQSRQALFEDRKKNQINRIVSMPTLTFTFLGKGIKLSGNCSYDSMVEAFQQLSKVATLPMHLSLSEKMLTYAYPNVRE